MMAKKVSYAEVAPLIPLPATSSQTFTYKIPSQLTDQILPFSQVTVPFGKRKVQGVVIKLHNFKVPYFTKDLALSDGGLLTSEQISLGQWISHNMHGGLGYTLRLFFPRIKPKPEDPKEIDTKKLLGRVTAESKKMNKAIVSRTGVLIDGDDVRRQKKIIELARCIASKGEQTLIIVPEKWLVKELEEAIMGSFPAERVTVIHSDLSARVDAQNWQKVSSGEALVVIGTQKSLFLPFYKLGLVILEEENFHSHKLWDAYPRLHNRLVVEQLAKIHDCRLVYSGSMPSLALYKEMKKGDVVTLQNEPTVLKTKVFGLTFADRKKRLLLPEELMVQMKLWVKRGEKIFVLHNRRGSWTTILCKSCHKVLRCPNCHLSLTVYGKNVTCQHCGTKEKMPDNCPYCHKKTLSVFGVGAEKMVDILGRNLNREIMMIDAPAMAGKKASALKKIFNKKQSPIVVGTTAALRFLDHEIIDRVVFMNPERSLLYPDFRSAERAVYLLFRLQKLLAPGKAVVLATSQQRTVIEELVGDAADIYERQLKERRRLSYPPYTDIVRLTFQASSLAGARKKAVIIRDKISKSLPEGAILRGPFQSFINQRRGNFETHLLLTGKLDELASVYSRLPIDTVDVWPERIL